MLAQELFSFVPLQEKPDGKKYIFECQHGEQECLGNMIEVKVQRKYTKRGRYETVKTVYSHATFNLDKSTIFKFPITECVL